MTLPPVPVTVTRCRDDSRRASLYRLIEKYGGPHPTPTAPSARTEQPAKPKAS